MKDYPLISVIVPVYGVEKYLRRAIDSLIAQTYPSIEIICIDDGSPDKSGMILDELAEKYSNMVVIHQENGGVSSARNAGLDIMKGEYFGFVDPDDFIEPDMYEFLYNAISNSKADIACCAHDNYYVHGIMPFGHEKYFDLVSNKQAVTRDLEPWLWGTCNRLFACSTCGHIRFSNKYVVGEDALFTIMADQSAKKIVYAMEEKYHYFHRGESACTRDFLPKDYNMVACFKKVFSICGDMGVDIPALKMKIMTISCIVPYTKGGIDNFPEYKKLLRQDLWQVLITGFPRGWRLKPVAKCILALVWPKLFSFLRMRYKRKIYV